MLCEKTTPFRLSIMEFEVVSCGVSDLAVGRMLNWAAMSVSERFGYEYAN